MKNKRVILKLGTSTLTAGSKNISLPHLIELVKETARLHGQGYDIILISSGAIAAGREALNHPAFEKHIPAKQMLASVGQSRLMEVYNKLFQMYDITVSQILLTREDLLSRRRYLNARNTLEALLAYSVIPIINENDTIATDEIRFGDNDTLSALVANLIEADLLIMLTDQDGLFTGDPKTDKNARLVEEISTAEIPEELFKAASGSNSGLGVGGMVTKLQAADLARRSGATVVITNGARPDLLPQIVAGIPVGTRFLPVISTLESRKRYMLANAQASSGVLHVDQGALQALRRGGSLLPVGVKEVIGNFERGDIVQIKSLKGKVIAFGMTNYSAPDLQLIYGQRSDQIEPLLGYTYGDEVVHHNNMMMLT
ncbi:MAG: glutamate 5-kinase [Anaerolineaceae bacterium]|nr:glutamate 5-kinase [Anaerolineaceae bacterium]